MSAPGLLRAPDAPDAPATLPAADAVARTRILCVDDEPNVLAALVRTLRPEYDVVTTTGARDALAMIEGGERFEVVVSDLRMPGVDGIALLGGVMRAAPDTTRVLLTGDVDLSAAIAAVNEGQIFRFLVKPCEPDALRGALRAAARQHGLVTAERVLLEQTVHGSIKALTDLLALVQPAAFGRATRLKRLVAALGAELGLPDQWQLEVAALLSQVGFITLPPETAERVHLGRDLSASEWHRVRRVPLIAEQLVASIPRLEAVRAILAHLNAPVDPDASDAPGEPVPLGARLLRVAHDFDTLEAHGARPTAAVAALEARPGWYHPVALAALRAVVEHAERGAGPAVIQMRLCDVQVGMVFAADVVAANGLLLVARGQEVTRSLLERITGSWYDFATTTRIDMVAGGGARPQPSAPHLRFPSRS